jgi:hypothetical protein
MNTFFSNHLAEIKTVAADQHVDIGVAFDKFRTDVRHGHAFPYNTGDSLPDTDFAALKVEWDTMTKDEQAACYAEWNSHIEGGWYR